jgi:hypothetical protein
VNLFAGTGKPLYDAFEGDDLKEFRITDGRLKGFENPKSEIENLK